MFCSLLPCFEAKQTINWNNVKEFVTSIVEPLSCINKIAYTTSKLFHQRTNLLIKRIRQTLINAMNSTLSHSLLSPCHPEFTGLGVVFKDSLISHRSTFWDSFTISNLSAT